MIEFHSKVREYLSACFLIQPAESVIFAKIPTVKYLTWEKVKEPIIGRDLIGANVVAILRFWVRSHQIAKNLLANHHEPGGGIEYLDHPVFHAVGTLRLKIKRVIHRRLD